MELNEIETQILTNLKDFVKLIPIHLEKWKDTLDPLVKKVKGISNMSEQLRAVSETHIEYMPDFSTTQEMLKLNILQCIEQDLKYVKDTIDKISRFNTQLKDKLYKLENNSLNLDWDGEQSILLQGTPFIPPLGKLLQDSLEVYSYFDEAYKNMKTTTARISFFDEDKMKEWENSFALDLDNNVVNKFIAITQYVDSDTDFT